MAGMRHVRRGRSVLGAYFTQAKGPTMNFRFDMSADAPELYAALSNVSKALEHAGLPGGLNHLIDLRVSQLNGCAYCIGLHTSWALRDGERRERLEAVANWRDSALFTPDERAAFAWAEALTQRQHTVLDGLHADPVS